MNYIEMIIETTSAGIEAITGALSVQGIEDLVVSDPQDIRAIMDNKDSYEWDYIDESVSDRMGDAARVTLYFADDEVDRRKVGVVRSTVKRIREAAAAGEYGAAVDFGTLKLTESVKSDTEWKDKWKEYFRPFRVSDRIVVRPSWEEYHPAAGEIVIEIDPGMAFGTGTHETTSLCIEMIDRYLKPGMKVLDAGCGSGILSIAAAMLGAGEVLAVDVDEDAVRTAQENIVRNRVGDIARAEYCDLTAGIGYRADLIAANLMAELIVMLAPDIERHLEDSGVFISSGILTEKKKMVMEGLNNAGFRITEIRDKGEWCCIVCSKGNV